VPVLILWTPMLVWFAALRPGLMSSDSIDVWRQATQGPWKDIHPPAYIFANWVSYQVVGSPSLVTLGQSLLLAAAICAVARALLRLGCRTWAVRTAALVVAFAPMAGAFSVTLWKDVPYSAAVLFLAARVIDVTRAMWIRDDDLARKATWSIARWGCLAVVMRQNGIVFVTLVILGLWVARRHAWRQLALALLVPLLLLGALKLAVYPVLGVQPSPTYWEAAVFLHDLAATAATDPGAFSAHDRELLERAAPLTVWASAYTNFGCSSVALCTR